tara:strand:- start:28 stop:252 length:225 start_codon:yes stop_codon:yes gene_type:complete
MIDLTNLLLFITTLSLIIMGGLLLCNWFTDVNARRTARRKQRNNNQRISEINEAAIKELMDRVALLESKNRRQG